MPSQPGPRPGAGILAFCLENPSLRALCENSGGAAPGDDDDLDIAGLTHDFMDQIASQKPLPSPVARAGQEDAGDLMDAGKINQGAGYV